MSIHDHEASRKMGVRKFYQKSGRYDYLGRIKKTIDGWVDPRTGLMRADYTRTRACPLCGSGKSRTAFTKRGFLYDICGRCGMMYVRNPLKDGKIDELYADSDYNNAWMKILESPIQRKFDRVKYVEGLKLLEKRTRGRKLLDIGCAAGFFPEVARGRGWDVTGIELNKLGVTLCRKKGLRIVDKKLDSTLFRDERFDAISMWDVMEHLADSAELLKNAHRVLNKGGLLLIETPNANSLAARILREKCVTFEGYAHVNMFSPETLNRFVERFGFRNVSMQTFISEINVINNYLEFYDPYTGASDNRDDVLGLVSFDDIHRNLLGYKMLAIYRKK